jgi:regulator of nonsense transcripts 1
MVQNRREVEAVIMLATELTERKKEFRIISPYATQTNLIMATLKELGMRWENMCFNVDSFQGNEADFIIISLVRTKTVGFLDNDRRANVLLTRCRKGMFVVCNRNLIVGDKGRNTLLGKFALAWTGNQQWNKVCFLII